MDALFDRLRVLHIPGLDAIESWLKKPENNNPSRLEAEVECRPWRTRLAFVRMMLDEPKYAKHLFLYWGDLFPAVVGPDVDLEQRRELMELLDDVRVAKASTKHARCSATLWMGLIFLTDPPEFASWRPQIRDAVFTVTDAPYDEAGDIWFRMADTLLAFEDPADWSSITQTFASDPIALRRAVRERMRGMASQHAAIEAEGLVDPEGLPALWLDAGRLLAVHPQAPGASELSDWWNRTMIEWLEQEEPGPGLGNGHVIAGHAVYAIALEPGPVISATLQQRLGEASLRWADRACLLDEKQAKPYIDVVKRLLPLLTEEQVAAVAVKMAPVLFRPPGYVDSYSQNPRFGHRLDDQRVGMLKRFWPHLSDEQQILHRQCLREVWNKARFSRDLLWLDACSSHPELSPEEWLLAAWVSSDGVWPWFRIGEAATMPGRLAPGQPYPAPAIDPQVARRLAERLGNAWDDAAVMTSNKGDRLSMTLSQVMALPDGQAMPAWLDYGFKRRVHLFLRDAPQNMTGEDFREFVMMGFIATGLVVPSDEDRLAIEARLNNARSVPSDCVAAARAFPEWWSATYADPDAASDRVAAAISAEDLSFLNLLLASFERRPPSPEVFSAVWEQLLESSGPHRAMQDRLRAYSALLRLAPQASVEKRLAMRERFRGFFAEARLPMSEWPRNELGPDYAYRTRGLGEGVAWDEDPLAAEWAWSSEIKLQANIYPNWGTAQKSNGVFSYLAQACSYVVDEGLAGMCCHRPDTRHPMPGSFWNRQPLMQPFEPTPWQRVRQLHLRRPDLDFADPLPYRPPGER